MIKEPKLTRQQHRANLRKKEKAERMSDSERGRRIQYIRRYTKAQEKENNL